MKVASWPVLLAIFFVLAALFLVGGDGTAPSPDRPDDSGISPEPEPDERPYPEGV